MANPADFKTPCTLQVLFGTDGRVLICEYHISSLEGNAGYTRTHYFNGPEDMIEWLREFAG